MLTLACLLAVHSSLSALVQPADAPKTDPIAAGAAWVKANAVAFKTPEAGNGFDDLKGLDAMIGNARIVSLGEPTHGTREAFQMKHRLLEYLVETKGFSIFSIEANMPESYALNEYVIDGKGDPAKLIAGMYFWTWNTEEVLAMVKWMRGWNERNPASGGKPRLQFTGFDMQTPDVAWRIANGFATKHAPDLAASYNTLLADVTAASALQSQGSAMTGWTTMTGTFPAEAARGKKLKFSCWIRTENVTGWAGAWWRCDTPAGTNGFNNMQDKNITGTTEWSLHEFTIDVPKDTQNINFGFMLNADGTAWFDDIEIELDGVKYENAKDFSFDFENDAVRYLSGGSREYAVKRTEEKPHGGKKCLEIRKKADNELPKVKPVDVAARAEKLVKDLESRRDALVKATSAKETDWAIQNARVVSQAAAMYASENGFNARDESMAANVRWILGQNPGQKVVLWAHNGHVSKAGYMGMKSMGTNLKETHAKEMVVFGFATGKGMYTAMSGERGGLSHDFELVTPEADSVEGVFMAAGIPNAIVDVRRASKDDPATAWAMTQRSMRSIGAMGMQVQFYPCVPAEMYDVLVWQESTTASRTLP